MERTILDTTVEAEPHEGIVIELRPAGLSPRAFAFLLDMFIRSMVIVVLAQFAQYMEGMGEALIWITWFALEWFYPVAFELSRWGATPGKRAFGLKVVMDNGLPVTAAASMTRNLLRVADFLPLAYGLAIVSLLVRRDGKRLGDRAAATLV